MKHLLLSTLFMALACLNLRAQSFDYPYIEDFGAPREKFLGAPNTSEGTQLIPVGNDLWEGNDVNTIHYGRVPSGGSNAPVVVFVHGYASRASVWFEGDDNMYADVYRDGYRSAFISLTPNRHMWTNGNMLARAIDRVANHYGVSKVILVGWSKGGVDSDAALTHFGANARVSQAFTLSTPHNGTSIAELANSVLLSLVNIIFMQDNDGTRALQRGYMNYFRSVTDGLSSNTVPFTTLGAWGNGPLNRLDIPQTILHGIDGPRADGGNDGVVPYNSSRRPGGTELFSGQRKEYYWWGGWHFPGPSQTELDHFEVTRGGLVWPYIKARIQNNNRVAIPTTTTPEDYMPNQSVTSRMQIVSAQKGERNILIGEGQTKVTLLVGQKADKPVTMRNAQGKSIKLTSQLNERLDNGGIKHQYVIENPEAGSYTIESDEAFVAIATFETGAQATLSQVNAKRVYDVNEGIEFKMNFENEKGEAIENAVASAVAVRTMDLEMNVTDDEPIAITFTKNKKGEFVANWKGAKKPGIYTISATAEGKNAQRTVNTSLAIAGELIEENNNSVEALAIATVYPNPSRGLFNINLELKNPESKLAIYNIYGQLVQQFDLADLEGMQRLTWDATGMEKGLYIIQLSDGENRVSKKVILE